MAGNFYKKRLKSVHDFRVGDKVFVTNATGYSFDSRVINKIPGTVSSISGTRMMVRFNADIYGDGTIDRLEWDYDPAALRHASEEPEVQPVVNNDGFKVGDKVRIRRCSYPNVPGFEEGTETTVVNITEHGVMLPYADATPPYIHHSNCLFHRNKTVELIPNTKPKRACLPFDAVINVGAVPAPPPPESVTITLPREDVAALTRLIGAISCCDGDEVAKHLTNKNFTYETWEKFVLICQVLGYTDTQTHSGVSGMLVLR